jgi:hypothetical protein
MAAVDALEHIAQLRADLAQIRSRMREIANCKDLPKSDCVQMLNGLVNEMTALNKEWKELLHRAIYSDETSCPDPDPG